MKNVTHLVFNDRGVNEILGSVIPDSYNWFENGVLVQPTNFIYEIIGEGELNIDEINAIENSPKSANRISEIRAKGFDVKFRNIQSATVQLNLQLIDSDLPQILAELLLLKYSTPGLALLRPTLTQLTNNNPINFDLSQVHHFYEYKIKNFLTESALRMTPSKVWTGHYDTTSGIVIVKENGELVCYHIYNRYEFQNYLLNNTRLGQASTSRYKFGEIYSEGGRTFMKLNLQVRFN